MARKKRSKRSGGGGGGGGGQIIIPSTLSSSSSAREDPPEEYNHVQQTTSIKINSTLPDPPPLSNDEEEQYEEYQDQEQLYRHRRGDYTRNPQQTTTTQITSFQQSTLQAGRPKNQSQSHSGGIISSTHRQFDLTPLSDVEMTSLGGRKQKCKKEKASHGNGNYAIYQTSSYTGRYNGLQMQNTPVDATKGRNAINPLEYNGQVLAYLDDGESSSSEESIEGRRSRQYEGYYTKQLNKSRDEEYYYRVNRSLDEILDDDVDSSGSSNDEERPLMSSLHGPEAILSRWEIWLNRTLVLLFVTICFIAGTERTPWWKEHKRRVASLSHHHHHILAGTDDDDFDIDLDPMTVYNTNDFDATRTRDHDPLHLYDHITMKGDMMDDEARGKYDAKKLGNDTAIIKKKYSSKNKNEDEGKKISQSPKDSSPKSKTPLKEVDVDDMASLLNDEWDKGVSQKKEEASAGELISKRPPSKSLHHGFVDKVIQPDSVAKTSGGVMGGGSSITMLKDPPKAPPLSNPVHPDDDNLVEWGAPDD